MQAHNHPTPQGLQEALQQERSVRLTRTGSEKVDLILRYGGFVGSVIECHDRLDRAMNRSRRLIEETEKSGGSVASGTVILADTMDGSKGRFERVWHAPCGGVWGCLLHADTLLARSRVFLPMAVGLACCEAIHDMGATTASLRWVNDVLFGEKKVAGFLVESYTGPVYREIYNLIGFGINLNNTGFPEELSGIAVSLGQVLGREVDITSFTTRFLAKLAWNVGLIHFEEANELEHGTYSGTGGQHQLLENWLNLSDTVGQRVRYGFDVLTRPQYEAQVTGLEPDGGLRMRLDDGSTIIEHSGEIRYL